MIRVHVREGFLGDTFVQHHEMAWWGQTPTEILRVYQRQEWSSVGCMVLGDVIHGDAWHKPVPDDADVILGPVSAGDPFSAAVVILIAQMAISAIAHKLAPKPKLPDDAAGPESVESPHQSWAGMRTTYGQGAIKSFVYGQVDVAGHAIYRRLVVDNGEGGSRIEKLRVILALGYGEFESIGGTRPGDREFVPIGVMLGPVPLNSKQIPGQEGNARFWARTGTQLQTPIEPLLFPGASQLVEANATMEGEVGGVSRAFVTYNSAGDVHKITAIVRFPQGYRTNSGAAPRETIFELYYRTGVGAPWNSARLRQFRVSQAYPRGVSFSFESDPLPAGVQGLIEVKLERRYSGSSANPFPDVDHAVLGHVQFETAGEYSYPGMALLAMEIDATDQLSGQTDFRVPVRAKRVRVWDQPWGWSQPTWGLAPSPHQFMAFPPAQNPAWIALDFMRHRKGLGQWLKDENIDLPAFRRFAAFCDQVAVTWNEAQFTFDGVIDTPGEAWAQLTKIMATARARPVMVGRRVSVRYLYSAEHSDGGVVVPERAMTQLFTLHNAKNVRLEGANTAGKHTVIDYQFLNRAKRFAQDTYPVTDPDSSVHTPTAFAPDRYRKGTQQAFGVVRTSQLYRDGIFEHRLQRHVVETLTFECGLWALAATVGDIIGFQHTNLRPHDRVPTACTIVVGGNGVTSVVIDHEVTLLAGQTHRLLVRTTDGLVEATVTGAQAGSRLTLASSIVCKGGDPALFGVQDKLVKLYEVVEVERAQDLGHKVTAVEYVASIHDAVPKPDNWLGALDGGGLAPESEPIGGGPTDLRVTVDERNPRALTASWISPPNMPREPVRLHARFPDDDTWTLLGESVEDFLALPVWRPHTRVRLCATLPAQAPTDEASVEVAVPEFAAVPPPAPSQVMAIPVADGLALEWDDTAAGDVLEFEVRRGAGWATGRVVYVGRAPRCIDRHPPTVAVPYWVRTRAHGGLYSALPVRLDPAAYTPPGTIALATRNELATLGGTLADLANSSGVLRHVGIRLQGTYESAELDSGSTLDVQAYWSAHVDRDEQDNLPPTDEHFGFAPTSAEAHWRLVDTRPASPARPGLDFRRPIDAMLGVHATAAPAALLATGDAGEVGANTLAVVESRFRVGGSWGAWQEHRDGWRLATRMQVRVTLHRRSSAWSTGIHTLHLAVHA